MSSQRAEAKTSTQVEAQKSIDAQETTNLSQSAKSGNTSIYPDKQEHTNESVFAGTAGLAVILGQLVACFSGHADVDDLDVLSFSLHHLFCRIDFLYRTVLPGLTKVSTSDNSVYARSTSASPSIAGLAPSDDLLYRQCIWTQLQMIKHVLARMEPLCLLLSDSTACILDALDKRGKPLPASGNPDSEEPGQDDEREWLHSAVSTERWKHAITALTDSLRDWQQSYNEFAPFIVQFASLMPAVPSLKQLDVVFNTLLDTANALFGDVLPRLQSVDDVEATVTLLFDMMQQSDYLVVQFDALREPLHTLIGCFAVGS